MFADVQENYRAQRDSFFLEVWRSLTGASARISPPCNSRSYSR